MYKGNLKIKVLLSLEGHQTMHGAARLFNFGLSEVRLTSGET
jgi:hypothetical protein